MRKLEGGRPESPTKSDQEEVPRPVYDSPPNSSVVAIVPCSAARILDVGCGTGANAAELRKRNRYVEIIGMTHSEEEIMAARRHYDELIKADVETYQPWSSLGAFDVILLSHVLEHLRDPAATVRRLSSVLDDNGVMIMAVPNFAHWKNRLEVLFGKLQYSESGLLDRTHLRFFTWDTAPVELVERAGLRLASRTADGHFPLGVARCLLPRCFSQAIDRNALRLFPNLFACQIILVASSDDRFQHSAS